LFPKRILTTYIGQSSEFANVTLQGVLSMWPSKRRLGEEKSKHAGLALQNGFGPASSHRMLRLVKGTAEPNI
jgi:hypothetical protein